MSRVWYCATCGYEVDRGGRCHSCKEPLVESPLLELGEGEADDEVGYRLADWDDTQRGDLIQALIDTEIRHRFEADELVVAADDEPAADAIVSQVSGGAASQLGDGDLDSDDDGEADEETVETLEALLDAARRLRTDPTDMIADGDLAEAGARVFHIDHAYGIAGETWAAIGRVTRRLLAALGADVALEDEIVGQAAVLCRLLEPIVSPQPTDAVPWQVTSSPFTRSTSYQPPSPPESSDGLDEGLGEGLDEDEDRHEVVYDMSDWLPEERAQLDLVLDDAAIGHQWEGADLVVADTDWDRVEELCIAVNPAHALDAELDDDGDDVDEEDRYKALSDLFGAADRLAGDPDAKPKRQYVVDAAGPVTSGPIPFGMSDDQWWQIRSRTRSLTDSIETDAGTDMVRASAAALRDLLRGFV